MYCSNINIVNMYSTNDKMQLLYIISLVVHSCTYVYILHAFKPYMANVFYTHVCIQKLYTQTYLYIGNSINSIQFALADKITDPDKPSAMTKPFIPLVRSYNLQFT